MPTKSQSAREKLSETKKATYDPNQLASARERASEKRRNRAQIRRYLRDNGIDITGGYVSIDKLTELIEKQNKLYERIEQLEGDIAKLYDYARELFEYQYQD